MSRCRKPSAPRRTAQVGCFRLELRVGLSLGASRDRSFHRHSRRMRFMYRLISTLAVMMVASGSQAAVTAHPWGIEPMPAVEHVVSVESGSSYGLVFGSGSDSSVLLAQGPPRGAGGPPGARGPGGGPDHPPSGPRGPGRPGFYPGPRPRPRPAPPPPPGPAGIIPHILPLFLPPPRP